MNKLTYSDSPFFSNWSQTYFTDLTLDQHIANNNWFMNTLTMLKDDGILYVPILDKQFDRLGRLVKWLKVLLLNYLIMQFIKYLR
jgi:hypothetical protein